MILQKFSLERVDRFFLAKMVIFCLENKTDLSVINFYTIQKDCFEMNQEFCYYQFYLSQIFSQVVLGPEGDFNSLPIYIAFSNLGSLYIFLE